MDFHRAAAVPPTCVGALEKTNLATEKLIATEAK